MTCTQLRSSKFGRTKHRTSARRSFLGHPGASFRAEHPVPITARASERITAPRPRPRGSWLNQLSPACQRNKRGYRHTFFPEMPLSRTAPTRPSLRRQRETERPRPLPGAARRVLCRQTARASTDRRKSWRNPRNSPHPTTTRQEAQPEDRARRQPGNRSQRSHAEPTSPTRNKKPP